MLSRESFFVTASAVALSTIALSQLAHADVERNPLHPAYYSARINIAPASYSTAPDAGEARNPLHPKYAHVQYTGPVATIDPKVLLALYEQHNPLHPMFGR